MCKHVNVVEDINDIDSDPDEGEEMNSIQSSIKSTILEDKAVAELEEKIAATGELGETYRYLEVRE